MQIFMQLPKSDVKFKSFSNYKQKTARHASRKKKKTSKRKSEEAKEEEEKQIPNKFSECKSYDPCEMKENPK